MSHPLVCSPTTPSPLGCAALGLARLKLHQAVLHQAELDQPLLHPAQPDSGSAEGPLCTKTLAQIQDLGLT
jgi:hypothetical protein